MAETGRTGKERIIVGLRGTIAGMAAAPLQFNIRRLLFSFVFFAVALLVVGVNVRRQWRSEDYEGVLIFLLSVPCVCLSITAGVFVILGRYGILGCCIPFILFLGALIYFYASL